MENVLEISLVKREDTCKLYHALANIYMPNCVKAKLSKIHLEKRMKKIKDYFSYQWNCVKKFFTTTAMHVVLSSVLISKRL